MYKYTLTAGVRSDVGNVRSNNEDNFYICGKYRTDVNDNNSKAQCRVTDRRALFSVCDGMGGVEFGEIASLIAVSNMRNAKKADFYKISGEDVQSINKQVGDIGLEKCSGRMGSTLSNLYIDNGSAIACNLGDSRTYLFRDNTLTKLSEDHDEATRLVNMGIITPEQALTDNRRHQLTQFLGMLEDEVIPEPYYSEEITIKDGDRFLICSDGVSDMLLDNELADLLNESLSAQDMADKLVDEALKRGSKDNCTALIVDVKKKPVLLYEF